MERILGFSLMSLVCRGNSGGGSRLDRLARDLMAAVRALQHTSAAPRKARDGAGQEWTDAGELAKKMAASVPAQEMAASKEIDDSGVAPVIEAASPKPKDSSAAVSREVASAAMEADGGLQSMGRRLELFGNQLGRVALAVLFV